ncbi:MAG: hypothetical protein KBC36_04960 [Spirochaetia bacterium]|nr:hypothetical protein [Spirochaetia bacterium]
MNEQQICDFVANNPGFIEPGLVTAAVRFRAPKAKGEYWDILAYDAANTPVIIEVKGRPAKLEDLHFVVAMAVMAQSTLPSMVPVRSVLVATGFDRVVSALASSFPLLKLVKFPGLLVSPSTISLKGFYHGIPASYDPFRRGAQGAGLIYYAGVCTVDWTRFFSYSKKNTDSRFSTPLKPRHRIGSSTGCGYTYVAKGLVQFDPNTAYSLPLVDPSAVFINLITPNIHPSSYRLFKDSADNLFIELDQPYRGDFSYVVGSDLPLTDLAFANPASFSIALPRQPSILPKGFNTGNPFSDYADLIAKMQTYFSTYDKACLSDFYDLESQLGQTAKITWMDSHREGSCRHRAFLAWIIMDSTGTPTRYDVSRTHAWIECFIMGAWRYIDPGGCPVDVIGLPSDEGHLRPRGMPVYSGPMPSTIPDFSCNGCPELPICNGRLVGRCFRTSKAH